MTDFWKTLTTRWQDSLNVLLGVWLILSPWALQFTGSQTAFWNAIVVGVIIAAAAFAALVEFHEWEEWADIAFGAWLVVSPWVLGFGAVPATEEGTVATNFVPATWNFVAVGGLTLLLAAWSLRDERHRVSRV